MGGGGRPAGEALPLIDGAGARRLCGAGAGWLGGRAMEMMEMEMEMEMEMMEMVVIIRGRHWR